MAHQEQKFMKKYKMAKEIDILLIKMEVNY